jgi:N utilization substance protein A
MSIKLSTEALRYMTLFESMTGAIALDCLEDEPVIFVVKEGCMSMAIGKNGNNIKRVERSIGKKIKVIEYSQDPARFIKNSFQPIPIKSIRMVEKDGKKKVEVQVNIMEKGIAIGKFGRNIERIKTLASRHHGISDVVVR